MFYLKLGLFGWQKNRKRGMCDGFTPSRPFLSLCHTHTHTHTHTDKHTHTPLLTHMDTHTHSHILDLPHAMNASSLVGQGSGTVKNRKLPNGTGMALLSTR